MHFTVNPVISWLSVEHHRYKPDFYLGESLIYFNRFIRLKRTWSHAEPVLGLFQGRSATAPKQGPGERPGPVNHQRYLFHVYNFSHSFDKELLWQDPFGRKASPCGHFPHIAIAHETNVAGWTGIRASTCGLIKAKTNRFRAWRRITVSAG
jgi:hypothetical protein